MSLLALGIAAFAASLLTFFTGFGLGTLLLPVCLLFLPLEMAVAGTAVVHLLNNLFKLLLLKRYVVSDVVIRFGLPAILAALAGAYVLSLLSRQPPIFQYSMFAHRFELYTAKLIIALLMIGFAALEIFTPSHKAAKEAPTWLLPAGGLLAGFFGGLSGHQGAIRSIFLLRFQLSKEQFIGSACAIAVLIDLARTAMYAAQFFNQAVVPHLPLVVSATVCALAGTLLGNRMLKKVSMKSIQTGVSAMLLIIALLLGAGVI